MNIYQRINAVMQEVEYIKKDATVQGYQAVTHDNVVAQVRASLIKHGIVIAPDQVMGRLHDKGMKYDYKQGKEVPDPMRMYEARYNIRFVNAENPEDCLHVMVESHALDNGDKAPGKALSYATKTAILKVFSIETGVNDESRVAEPLQFTDIQKEEFDELIEGEKGLEMLIFSHTTGPDIFSALYNSFEKGQITKGKKAVDALIKKGHETIQDYVFQIKEAYNSKDPAISELTGELTDIEKRLVMAHLDKEHIDYLRNLSNG